MLFVVLIVSALPWLPTPLSIQGLGLLAIAAGLSRCPWIAAIALCVMCQELRISAAISQLWSPDTPAQLCQGRAVVRAVHTLQPPETVVVVTWQSSDCARLRPGDRTRVRIPFLDVQRGDVLQGVVSVRPLIALSNPGGWDARRGALTHGIVAQGQWRAGSIEPGTGLRRALRERLEAWPQPLGGLALALLFGERVALSQQLYDQVSLMGLAHLLAISGLHVGLVLGAVWWVSGRVLRGCHPRHRLFLQTAIISVLGLALADWTQWSASVSRAVGMLIIAAVLRSVGWRVDLMTSLLWTALVMVLWTPLLGLSSGYWMSVIAVATIAWLHGITPLKGLRGVLRMQWVFSTTLNASLSMALGFVFPWLGLLSNLVIVPLLGPLLVGLAGLLISDATAWATLLNQGVRAAFDGVEWLQTHALLRQEVATEVLLLIAVFGVLSVLPACVPRALCGMGCVLVCLLWPPRAPLRQLQVVDVGQGSAAVLQVGASRWVFDLGPGQPGRWDRFTEIAPALFGAEDVHVLLSHGDLDHVGAFEPLRRERVPDSVVGGGRMSERAMPCLAGQVWAVDGITIEVLWPDRINHAPENRASCVVLVSDQAHAVLLMGDADWFAEAQTVRALAARDRLGAIDVVIASHHGARDGSNPSFQAVLGAEAVVISVGATNRFGHPNTAVIEGWQRAGARVYRTDRDGALTYRFGKGLQGFRERSPSRW